MMNHSLCFLILVLSTLFTVNASLDQTSVPINSEIQLESHDSDYRSVVQGDIQYGQFINCEVFNETPHDFIVMRYVYEFLVRDSYGRMINQSQLYQCVSGCFVESFSYVRLSGPRNSPHLLRASCKALVRKIDWYNDDDWHQEGPKIFDRW
jgi:hypothetical protein